MDATLIATIISSVLAIVAAVAGKQWNSAKNKGVQLQNLLNDVINSVQDNTVSEAECQKITADAKALAAGL